MVNQKKGKLNPEMAARIQSLKLLQVHNAAELEERLLNNLNLSGQEREYLNSDLNRRLNYILNRYNRDKNLHYDFSEADENLAAEAKRYDAIADYAHILESKRRHRNLTANDLEFEKQYEQEIFGETDIVKLFSNLMFVRGNAAIGIYKDILPNVGGENLKYGARVATHENVENLDLVVGNVYDEIGDKLEQQFLRQISKLSNVTRNMFATVIRNLVWDLDDINLPYRKQGNALKYPGSPIKSALAKEQLDHYTEYFDCRYHYRMAQREYVFPYNHSHNCLCDRIRKVERYVTLDSKKADTTEQALNG